MKNSYQIGYLCGYMQKKSQHYEIDPETAYRPPPNPPMLTRGMQDAMGRSIQDDTKDLLQAIARKDNSRPEARQLDKALTGARADGRAAETRAAVAEIAARARAEQERDRKLVEGWTGEAIAKRLSRRPPEDQLDEKFPARKLVASMGPTLENAEKEQQIAEALRKRLQDKAQTPLRASMLPLGKDLAITAGGTALGAGAGALIAGKGKRGKGALIGGATGAALTPLALYLARKQGIVS
jgi:hypothetical protein